MVGEVTVVIGGGTAGTQAARALARAGRRVVITDPGPYGGTCIWRGCVPKKTLYSAAGLYQAVSGASRGLGAWPEQPPAGRPPDWRRVLAWQQDAMRGYAGDQEGILRELGVQVLHGRARFRSPDVVEIDGEPFRAEAVVVATGSRAVLPGLPGGEHMDTSDQALFYPEQPASLVVVGGGYVAMEVAGIYAALGTAVQLVVRGPRVLRRFDPECAQVAVEGLRELGVTVHLDTDVARVSGRPGALQVETHSSAAGDGRLVAERVLAATGRRPVTDDLDLAAGQVQVDDRGRLLVDASLRSLGNPRVWVAGDAAGGVQLTPVASYEGGYVAQAILNETDGPADLSTVPSTCFTHPQVAGVGMSEAQVADRGAPYLVSHGDFGSTAEAVIRGERGGLVKLLADDRGRLLGAHLAGPDASELIYGLALGLRAGITLDQIGATVAVHPSFAEALNWASFSRERVDPGS